MARKPTIPSVIRAGIREALSRHHAGLPAKVTAFYPADRTCDVKIMLKRGLRNDDGSIELQEYPPLLRVPVRYTQGAGFSIRFPLKEGNKVYLTFSDRAIDNYMEADSDEPVDPELTRWHDMNDAVAVPAPFQRKTDTSPEIRDDALVIGNDANTVEIELNGDTVKIRGKIELHAEGDADANSARFDELKSELDSMRNTYNGHTHMVSTVGGPAAQSGTSQAPIVPLPPFSNQWKSNVKVK